MANYKLGSTTQHVKFADYGNMVFLTYNSYNNFPSQGETNKYYYDSGQRNTYVWNGTRYVLISDSKSVPVAYVRYVDENGTANYVWARQSYTVQTNPYVYHHSGNTEWWETSTQLTEKVTRSGSSYAHNQSTGVLSSGTIVYAGDSVQFEYDVINTDDEFISADCSTYGNVDYLYHPIQTTISSDCKIATTQSFVMPWSYRPELKVGTWTTVWEGSQQMVLQKTTDTSLVFNNTISGLSLQSGKVRVYINVTPSSFYDDSEGYAVQGRLPQTYTGSYGLLEYVWDVVGLSATPSSSSSSLDGSVTVSISAGEDANTTAQDITFDDVYVTKIEVLLENQPNVCNLNLVIDAGKIRCIYVKSSGDSAYTFIARNTTIKVPVGMQVQMYAEPNTGYSTTYNSGNPLTINMTSSGYTFEPIPVEILHTLTLTKNPNIESITYRNMTTGANSTYAQSTTVQVREGSSIELYATPATGYETTYYSFIHSYNMNMYADYEFSPVATRISHTLSLVINEHITSISYKIDNGSYTTVNVSTQIQVGEGNTVYMYATPNTGYSTTYTSSNPNQITMDDDYTFSPVATSAPSWHTIWSGTQTMRSEGSTTITSSVAADTSWTYRITGTTLGTSPQEATGAEGVGQASVTFGGTNDQLRGGIDIAGHWSIELTVVSNGTTSMTLTRTDSIIGQAVAPFAALTKVEAYYVG